MQDTSPVKGHVTWELRGPDGTVVDSGAVHNLVTQAGNQYYADRAAGIAGAPAAVTGMQLGVGTTTAATTGAGAAVVTVVANSLVALSVTPTSSAGAGTSRRITYTASWGPGVATNAALSEVVLVNQSTATQTVAPAANTIARALPWAPSVNKGASDTLTITWTHDIGS